MRVRGGSGSTRVCKHRKMPAGPEFVRPPRVHQGQIQGFFNIPVDHLTAFPLLSRHFAALQLEDAPPLAWIAVNVSPIQFRDPNLAAQIVKVLAATGFPASRLEIEITEGSLLEDRDQVTTILQSLKNLGISISLDDFGTGYASLSQLHTLPVDRIKIDRGFINTMVKSERTAAIVNTIASLGHKLNVPITAEGVETESIRGELAAGVLPAAARSRARRSRPGTPPRRRPARRGWRRATPGAVHAVDWPRHQVQSDQQII